MDGERYAGRAGAPHPDISASPLATDLYLSALAAIGAFAAVQPVSAFAAVQPIVAATAFDRIGAATAAHPVVAGTAEQGVFAVPAADPVVTASAVDAVGARASEDHIGARGADEDVVAVVTDEGWEVAVAVGDDDGDAHWLHAEVTLPGIAEIAYHGPLSTHPVHPEKHPGITRPRGIVDNQDRARRLQGEAEGGGA